MSVRDSNAAGFGLGCAMGVAAACAAWLSHRRLALLDPVRDMASGVPVHSIS